MKLIQVIRICFWIFLGNSTWFILFPSCWKISARFSRVVHTFYCIHCSSDFSTIWRWEKYWRFRTEFYGDIEYRCRDFVSLLGFMDICQGCTNRRFVWSHFFHCHHQVSILVWCLFLIILHLWLFQCFIWGFRVCHAFQNVSATNYRLEKSNFRN